MAARLVSVDDTYLFPTPLEARLAAKMSAAVNDTAVSALVNAPSTGAAIDARINTQVTPVVQQIAADYIASEPAVVDAAAAAVDANPTIASLMPKSVDAPAGFDANAARGAAHYHVHSADAGLNMPNSGSPEDSFDLEVKPIAWNTDIQLAMSLNTGGLFYRTRYNEAFSVWSKIGGPGLLSSATAAATYQTKTDATNSNWYRGALAPANEFNHADTAPDGFVAVWSSASATAAGLPVADLGVVFTRRMGTSGIQTFTTFGGQIWHRGRWGNVWATTFKRIDAGAATTPVSGNLPQVASGMKAVPLSLTLGTADADAPLTGTYRIPQKWNAPITRWRICASNRNVRNGNTRGTGIVVNGIWAGAHAGNGAFAVTPTKAAGSFTVPDDGTAWKSGWINSINIGGNQDVLFSYDYSATTAPPRQVAGAYYSTSLVGGEVEPAGLTLGNSAALDLWIEAETYAGTPVVAALGDSLSSGAQATLACHDSTISIYARAKQSLPVHYAVSSDTLSDWIADPAEWKVSRWSHLARPDVCLLAMGHNDIYGLNIPQATLQTNFATALPIIREVISPNIIGATITPRNAGTPEQHTIRHDYNTFLKGRVSAGELRDIVDFDQIITGGTDIINPAYNADGIHFNTAGYQAESDGITRPITSPPVMYATI